MEKIKKSSNKKKVLICGAGSIGIYLGVKLALKEHDIKFLGRRKLKNAGKEIFINKQKFKLSNKIFSMPKNENYDIIFLTCKLYDLEKITRLLHKNKIKAEIISNIQNGLVDLSKYEKILHKKIIPICVFGGFRIEKNKIQSFPTSVGWIIKKTRQGKELSSIISDCGIKCTSKKNFNSLKAEKMIVNCCLNALSAIEKKPFNELFSKKNTKKRIERIFDETFKVLAKEYKLKNHDKMKRDMIKNWSKTKHYSSTFQDVKSGRKTEINFFNGYIIKKANQYKINAKENKQIMKDFAKIK